MKRPRFALSSAVLAALLLFVATAQANDFIPPSPVPSSRDSVKAKTTTNKQAKTQLNNNVLNNKIVKTTKPSGGTGPTGKAPGAL